MNQQRLLCLLHADQAPQWFIKAIEREYQSLEYGEPFSGAAQRLWTELREGHRPEDAEIVANHYEQERQRPREPHWDTRVYETVQAKPAAAEPILEIGGVEPPRGLTPSRA